MLNFPFAVQIYAEAESRTNLFVMPRRNSIYGASQIYAEAESRTNLFVMPRREPYFRRSRISQKPKVAYLARKGRVPGLYGGGESATVSRQNDSLSPKNTTLH